MDKSEGLSTKLTYDSSTPFVVPSGKNLYFVTSKSISKLNNNFSDKTVVIKLHENELPFYRQLSFKKNGELSSISFEELDPEKKRTATLTQTQLDSTSLHILKKELLKRMTSVRGEYQNKYDPESTITALEVCKKVKSSELTAATLQQIDFFKKISSKRYGPVPSPAKKNLGSK